MSESESENCAVHRVCKKALLGEKCDVILVRPCPGLILILRPMAYRKHHNFNAGRSHTVCSYVCK